MNDVVVGHRRPGERSELDVERNLAADRLEVGAAGGLDRVAEHAVPEGASHRDVVEVCSSATERAGERGGEAAMPVRDRAHHEQPRTGLPGHATETRFGVFGFLARVRAVVAKTSATSTVSRGVTASSDPRRMYSWYPARSGTRTAANEKGDLVEAALEPSGERSEGGEAENDQREPTVHVELGPERARLVQPRRIAQGVVHQVTGVDGLVRPDRAGDQEERAAQELAAQGVPLASTYSTEVCTCREHPEVRAVQELAPQAGRRLGRSAGDRFGTSEVVRQRVHEEDAEQDRDEREARDQLLMRPEPGEQERERERAGHGAGAGCDVVDQQRGDDGRDGQGAARQAWPGSSGALPVGDRDRRTGSRRRRSGGGAPARRAVWRSRLRRAFRTPRRTPPESSTRRRASHRGPAPTCSTPVPRPQGCEPGCGSSRRRARVRARWRRPSRRPNS